MAPPARYFRLVRLMGSAVATLTGRRASPELEAKVRLGLQRGGHPLDEDVRDHAEAALGHDFSRVRIHADAAAAELAAATQARAFTVGHDLFFGQDRFQPTRPEGRWLLLHELAHVAQDSGGRNPGDLGGFLIGHVDASEERDADIAVARTMTGKRAVLAGQRSGSGNRLVLRRNLLTQDRSAVPAFEYSRGRQRRTTRMQPSSTVRLAYDDTTGVLSCTFPMRWRFPRGWPPAARGAYIDEFEAAVRGVWQDRYVLTERGPRGRPTGRRARVVIGFNHQLAPDFANDTEYATWLARYGGGAVQRWTMNVSNVARRDHVDAPVVALDPGSNRPTRNVVGSELTNPTLTDQGGSLHLRPPTYSHYADARVRIRTPRAGTSYNQQASAHEFGHMIGLDNEYVLNRDDWADVARGPGGRRAADAALRRRNTFTDRIMNSGSRMTPDAYQPFAAWLSEMTRTTWAVGRAVTAAQRAAPGAPAPGLSPRTAPPPLPAPAPAPSR